jgi:deoxyhypusine synthase
LRQVKKKNVDVRDSPNYLSKDVQDYSINQRTSINQILKNMTDSGGFEGRHLANGVEILKNMLNEKTVRSSYHLSVPLFLRGTEVSYAI